MKPRSSDDYYSHFPYSLTYTSFCQRSVDYNLRHNPNSQKNIILGGRQPGETSFYQIKLDRNENGKLIQSYSFKNDYNKENADLKKIGWHSADRIDSYFISNDEYMACLRRRHDGIKYNVYDFKNDKWMINECIELEMDFDSDARSLFLFNHLFIFSYLSQLYFYTIFDDFLAPKLIKTYFIKNDKLAIMYTYHGMCCIANNKSNDRNLRFEILLFGGNSNVIDTDAAATFLDSFLSLKVELKINYQDLEKSDLKITEQNLKINCINFNPDNTRNFLNFGFECLLNSNNEATIILIGGDCKPNSVKYSIYEFNTARNELKCYAKVCLSSVFDVFKFNL